MVGDLPTPVSFVLLMKQNGLGLAEAHNAVNNLAANGSVTVSLRPRNLDDLFVELERLGLSAKTVKQVDRLKNRKADVS